MRRPESRAIMAACDGGVSYRAKCVGGVVALDVLMFHAGCLITHLGSMRRGSSGLSLGLIIVRDLICAGDKIRAAAYELGSHCPPVRSVLLILRTNTDGTLWLTHWMSLADDDAEERVSADWPARTSWQTRCWLIWTRWPDVICPFSWYFVFFNSRT